MSALAARDATALCVAFAAAARLLRRSVYVVSGVLLAAASARAEAPVLSQEFWNYMVEFGDSQGEVFDPADYAALATVLAKVAERAPTESAHTPRQQDAGSKYAPTPTGEELSQ